MATNRKVLQISGSTLENIKALTGDDAINARELLVATDTGELIIGTGEGNFKVIGEQDAPVQKGTTEEREVAEATEGALFFDTDMKLLFIGDGTEWKAVGTDCQVKDAVENNLASFGTDGVLKDSGISVNDEKVGKENLWSSTKITQAITDSVNGMSWQAPVKSVITDSLPETNEEGDRYLVLVEGDEHNDKIVEFNGTAWEVTDPIDGMAVFDQANDHQYAYNGTSWVNISAGFTYSAGTAIKIQNNEVGVDIAEKKGITTTPEGGLMVDVDGSTVVVDAETGKVGVGSLDFGEF